MFNKVLLLVLFLMQSGKDCYHMIEIDPLGNIFTVKDNVLTKEDRVQRITWTYFEPANGTLSKIQVQNPNLVLLFYPDVQKVELLNRDLSIAADPVDLNDLGLPFQVKHIAGTAQRNMWVLDEVNLSMLRYDLDERLVVQKVSLLGALRTADDIVGFSADLNGLYIELAGGQYLIFSAQGTFDRRESFVPNAKWLDGKAYHFGETGLQIDGLGELVEQIRCIQGAPCCDYAKYQNKIWFVQNDTICNKELKPCIIE